MTTYPAPDREGHFYAKLVTPTRMPAKEDWASVDWEVVQVADNNGDGDERWFVLVPGIAPAQWPKDFEWGPEVVLPAELRGQP